jgi:ribosome biogenesis protein Nip4
VIDEFISKFTEQKLLHIVKIGRAYYHVLPELRKRMEKADSSLGREAQYAGVFLGEEKGKRFMPSIALLDTIGRATHRWVMIDDKAEWLFLCGRDVFAGSVMKANVKSGMVIVCNRRKEVLGYGRIAGDIEKKDKVYVRNLLDRGDFLRREMSRKKGRY